MRSNKGFTLIELLIVVAIIGIMLTVSLPMSVGMYENYKASIKAQEVMVFLSGVRRESFLYSEKKVLFSQGDVITVDEQEKVFPDTRIRIETPIIFYRNGTTSGGTVRLYIGGQSYLLAVSSPLGNLLLTRIGSV